MKHKSAGGGGYQTNITLQNYRNLKKIIVKAK